MNEVQLIGRLTKDIEIRYTDSQKAIGRFTVAVDRAWDKERTDFISCKAWGKTAETMERYTGKGQKIAITGRIETGRYEDNEGRTVYTTDVVVNRVEFLEWREEKKDDFKVDDTKWEDFESAIPF